MGARVVERRPVVGCLPRFVGVEGAEGKKMSNGRGTAIGGLRTLRYMLKARSALFAWGTYLDAIGQVSSSQE